VVLRGVVLADHLRVALREHHMDLHRGAVVLPPIVGRVVLAVASALGPDRRLIGSSRPRLDARRRLQWEQAACQRVALSRPGTVWLESDFRCTLRAAALHEIVRRCTASSHTPGSSS
jgi:hypothetical protein